MRRNSDYIPERCSFCFIGLGFIVHGKLRGVDMEEKKQERRYRNFYRNFIGYNHPNIRNFYKVQVIETLRRRESHIWVSAS